MVSSAPTILWPQLWIPSTPSKLFSICIEIVTRKEQKLIKKRQGLAHFEIVIVSDSKSERVVMRKRE